MIDVDTVLALRDAVRVEERGTAGSRVLIGDQVVFRFPGCGNQHANNLMSSLRAALTEYAAKAGESVYTQAELDAAAERGKARAAALKLV